VAYYLPLDSQANSEPIEPDQQTSAGGEMSDLKIFWGPEICRLEYLLHLLDTGRIVDERVGHTA
jgi:hypothetical protein